MRYSILTITCLFGFAATALADVPAFTAEEVAELMALGYEDMSPEEIARHFAHPNGYAGHYAIRAMVGHGDAAVPLLEKLTSDSHPLVRQGALAVLIELRQQQLGDTPEDTPELRRLISQMKQLAEDATLAKTIAKFLLQVKIDNEDVREIALKLAQDSDPGMRDSAVKMGAQFIKDPETVVKIGMYCSAGPKNIPRGWGTAHSLILKHKDKDVSRQGIPVVARFLRDTANTLPVRGMFSDGPQKRALELIGAQWDAEVQQMPEVVPAICRTYVRAPYSKYGGWVVNRNQVGALLMKLDRDAVPAMRATIAEEKEWLAAADDLAIKASFEQAPAKGREKCKEFVAYLEYLADTLEAGKPVEKQPPGPPAEPPKAFEDDVPDPDELDLDGLLDD